MEYVYASLLLHYAKRPITEESLRKVLEAAGIDVDEVRVKAVVAALSNVNIDEAIKSVSFAMPMPAMSQPVAQATSTATGPAEEKKEEQKEEKKEAASEEEVAEGLAALFG